MEDYFRTALFPKPDSESVLQRTDRQPMVRYIIPAESPSGHDIATPMPGVLYGYNRDQAFDEEGEALLFNSLENVMVANARCLLFPFLSVEFRGERDGLWGATTHCMGASAACARAAARFNGALRAPWLPESRRSGSANLRVQHRHERHRGTHVHYVGPGLLAGAAVCHVQGGKLPAPGAGGVCPVPPCRAQHSQLERGRAAGCNLHRVTSRLEDNGLTFR